MYKPKLHHCKICDPRTGEFVYVGSITMTNKQHATLKQQAKDMNMSLAAWLRHLVHDLITTEKARKQLETTNKETQ